MLPDIPKNMPNRLLIQEFETDSSMPTNCCRDTATKASTSSNRNFVKKIVEAYESNVRAPNENSQQSKENSNFFNTLNFAQNRKNAEKSGLSLAIYNAPSSHSWKNLNGKSEIFSTPFEAHNVEDDFVIFNRYHSESDEKTVSETESPSKINKRNQQLDDKTKNKLMICSSPLENSEDNDLDRDDLLDDILTSSCDSSSNNSYRNLKANLYDFEDKQWQSVCSSSLKSSWGLSLNNINSDDGSLNTSFQNVNVISSKDTPKSRKNLQDSKPNPSSNFDRKSSQATVASLNDQPIKIDNDTCVTWMSALGEKLSRKRPLKELLKSAFNTKLLNYKKVWKKSAEKQPKERTSGSGFIEQLLLSRRSDLDEKPSVPPTSTTFSHAGNACVSDKIWSKSSRMVLTEVPREEFTSDSKPSDSTLWVPSSTTFRKESRVESSSKSTMLPSSSKLEASCGYPPLAKHPYLTRNRIRKHPFVAKTKLDQEAEEKSIGEEEMRCDAKESELKPLDALPVSQVELDLLYSNSEEKSLFSTTNRNCDLLK